MKRQAFLRTIPLFFGALFIAFTASAQKKPLSPHLGVMGEAAGSTITIRYGSPYVKGRKIWGGLEPYGKVYRAGADSATTFTTSKDIKVDGKLLPAGKYAFFVIPAETGKWTVIFNKTAEQWGAFDYNEKTDQLRIMVTPKEVPMTEQLKYVITSNGFSMAWDKVSIPVTIN